jgi:hypothetical protein
MTWKTVVLWFGFAPKDGLTVDATGAQLSGFPYPGPHFRVYIPKQ